MADENSNPNPVSSLLGYKPISDNSAQNGCLREQHINEAFEDNELNYNPPLNGYARANLGVANSRFTTDNSDSPYIESYITPPAIPYIGVNMKEGGLYRADKFENDINLKDSANKAPNGVHPKEKESPK